MRARAAGFTLVELVVAMALLGAMLLLLYSGLAFGLRSWDAADTNGRRAADRQIAENFLRREIGETFPLRFKDPLNLKLAFDGQKDALRFASARPAGISAGGLSLVGIAVEASDDRASRTRNLVMRRAMPDDAARDFGPLDKADKTVLFENVDSIAFQYFGSENDFTEPQWVDGWTFAGRVPQLIRVRLKMGDGSMLPDMVVRLMLSEEAGCLESAFQRVCRPRRDL